MPDSLLASLLLFTVPTPQFVYLAWPLVPLVSVLVIGLRFNRRARPAAMAAAAGFGSIVIEIALLIVWQMLAGSVYFALAGLTGAFMAGLGLGSGWAARADFRRMSYAAALIVPLAAGLAVAAVTFVGLHDLPSPVVFALFAALLALLAAGVGATFVVANALESGGGTAAETDSGRSAGLVYGLELLGSAGGGLLAGVFLVPCFGAVGALMLGAAGMIAVGGLAWPSRS